ncbi:MAG: hypothetical protein LQ350_005398 [Teloschistes chrysophthalmus]|nr:MAG: hypothetical protein LQ350_005398 [Niorma chrysophthalma]
MTSRASQPWAASTTCAAASHAREDTNPDTAFATDPAVFESSSSSVLRKRKPPGSITPNACTNCKKARAKAVKEKLMSEIHRLRDQNQQLVQENLHLGKSNDSLEEILRTLKDDQKGQEILHLLKLGKDHQYIAAWLSQPHLSLDLDLDLDLKGPHIDVAPQDFDFSHRFDTTATGFDQEVDSTEWLMGVTKMRRRIVEKAHGNVLEAAVGTGRNSDFYDLGRIKSLTLLDQSQEMLEVARAKWKKAHRGDQQCRLLPWSALDAVPPPPADSNGQGVEGYDTIIATLSLCSIIGPSLFLRNLAGHLAPPHTTRPVTSDTSPDPNTAPPARIYLLEHGRSYYSWLNKILDRTASAHASKHGCWWNRDIGKIAEDSGLEIINLQRRHFGTTWSVELGLPERARGQDRQQWLEENRRKMITMRAEVERQRKEGEEFMRKQEEAREEKGALERWRTEQREQMREKDS